jgi:hypothetical protein
MPKLLRTTVDFFPRLSAGEKRIAQMLDNVRDLRPLMIRQIAPLTLAMLKRHWDSKGAAFGHKWAPWAKSTAAARERKGNVALGLLRDTDHLYEAIFRTRSTDSRLKNIAGGLRFQLNTQIPYGIFHQLGTKRMPARQIFPQPMPLSFRQDIRGVVRAYILRRANG